MTSKTQYTGRSGFAAPRTTFAPRLRRLLAIASLVGGALIGLAAPAGALASFPGANGSIVFVRSYDIWSINPDGSSATDITNTSSTLEQYPSFSSDGGRIVFTASTDTDFLPHVWVMDADGTNRVQLTTGNDYQPRWSRDGTQIVFMRGGLGIWVMNSDGSGQHAIVGSQNAELPTWSPDGSKIAYNDNTTGNHQIYTVAPDGSGRTQVTTGPGTNLWPDWSPDGTRIAFMSDGLCAPFCYDQIYVVDADGSNLTQLTTRTPADASSPVWSPDGRRIAYMNTGPSGGNHHLATMNADGTDIVELTSDATSSGANEGSPSWASTPADATAPSAVLTTPQSGAQYSLGQPVAADFACTDEPGGSGIASCAGDADGTPVGSGAAVPTGVAGTHTFTVTATDAANNTASVVHTYEVLAGSTSQSVSGGQTVTTDPGNTGATTDVPVQTAITVPGGVDGTLAISLQDTTGAGPTGYSFFGKQVELSGPVASAAAPYQVTFAVDASLLGDVAPADLQIFRNGAVVSGCRDATAAVPDPCVASRAIGSGGDAIVTVRTSHFSTWNVGSLRYTVSALAAPILAPPSVNAATAGATISLRFSLGGNRGLDVFAAGYPRSAAYPCGGAAPSPSAGTATAGTLTYDASKDKYTYVWKTAKTMKGCRQVALRFRDASLRTALFNLK